MPPLEAKIGRMMLVGFEGYDAPDHILRWLDEGRIGGAIFFARNVESPEQLARLTSRLRGAARRPILISIDQEGGTVARLRAGFTESPGAMALSAAADGETLSEQMSNILASELRTLGINWNYAPVVDLVHSIENPSVGTRSYGSDQERVARLAAAAVRSFQSEGVAACLKHFPGLGNTPVDTHVDLAVISDSPDYLYQHDLVPFRAAVAAGAASVMMTHVKFTALDARYPATMSPVVIGRMLRDEIGFSGVITTDCMEMKAITRHFSPGESAVNAVAAGVDVVLFSHTLAWQEAAYDGVRAAVADGRIPEARIEEAVGRIDAMLERFPATPAPDLSRIRLPAHVQAAREAAFAGCVLLRADSAVFPLTPDVEGVMVVEFASVLESGVMESGGQTGFAQRVQARASGLTTLSLLAGQLTSEQVEAANALAAQAEILILATRNAHLIPAELAVCRELLAAARQTILLPLRNPYDAGVLTDAGTILCTCGDSSPSLDAAVAALFGDFRPQGRLPVPLNAGVEA